MHFTLLLLIPMTMIISLVSNIWGGWATGWRNSLEPITTLTAPLHYAPGWPWFLAKEGAYQRWVILFLIKPPFGGVTPLFWLISSRTIIVSTNVYALVSLGWKYIHEVCPKLTLKSCLLIIDLGLFQEPNCRLKRWTKGQKVWCVACAQNNSLWLNPHMEYD